MYRVRDVHKMTRYLENEGRGWGALSTAMLARLHEFREFYTLSPGEAEDLVNAKGKPIRVADRRMRHDFWLDEENQWKLSEFIRSCGVETAGRSFGETLPEVKNAPVFVQVTQTPDKQKRNEDGSPIIYNNIARLTGQAGAQG